MLNNYRLNLVSPCIRISISECINIKSQLQPLKEFLDIEKFNFYRGCPLSTPCHLIEPHFWESTSVNKIYSSMHLDSILHVVRCNEPQAQKISLRPFVLRRRGLDEGRFAAGGGGVLVNLWILVT